MGYIYIINQENSNLHKIGISDGFPTIRANVLQIGNPQKLNLVAYYQCDDPLTAEQTIHTQLGNCLVRGEWFNVPTLDVLYLLQSYIKNQGKSDSFVLYRDCVTWVTLPDSIPNKLSDADDSLNIKSLGSLENKVRAMYQEGYTKTQMMYELGFTNGLIYKEYSPVVDSIIARIIEEKVENG